MYNRGAAGGETASGGTQIHREAGAKELHNMTPQNDLITIPSIENLTRREFLSSALAAALLIACGEDEEEPADQSAKRIINTARGSLEVPVNPQRVVTLGATMDLQVSDDLGAALVAAGGTEETRVHVTDKAKKLPIITSGDSGPNIEAIIAANPDLILTNTSGTPDETTYQRLTQIAPTVIPFSDETRNDWRGSMLILADALNRRDLALQRFQQIDARVAEIGSKIKTKWPNGIKVSVLRITDPGGVVRSYRTGSGRIGLEILHKLAGVTITGNTLQASSPTASNISLSPERLREADADVILYFGPRDKSEAAALIGGVTSNPLWPSLAAVQARRAYEVTQDVWFDGFGFTGINLALDDMFEYLT
jgi:iron complex transport system substrate-binding protein